MKNRAPIAWRGLSSACEFFDLDGNRFHVPLSEAQRSELKLSEGPHLVTKVTVSVAGIELDVMNCGCLLYRSRRWHGWWCCLDAAELKGADAVTAISDFSSWRLDQVAIEALEEIKSGRLAFEDLRPLPELFQHPKIQSALAKAFSSDSMPKRAKGKRASITAADFEIFNWVDYYRRCEGVSIEQACSQAVVNHPEHVPDTWEKDPEGALSKRYKEIWLKRGPGTDNQF